MIRILSLKKLALKRLNNENSVNFILNKFIQASTVLQESIYYYETKEEYEMAQIYLDNLNVLITATAKLLVNLSYLNEDETLKEVENISDSIGYDIREE